MYATFFICFSVRTARIQSNISDLLRICVIIPKLNLVWLLHVFHRQNMPAKRINSFNLLLACFRFPERTASFRIEAMKLENILAAINRLSHISSTNKWTRPFTVRTAHSSNVQMKFENMLLMDGLIGYCNEWNGKLPFWEWKKTSTQLMYIMRQHIAANMKWDAKKRSSSNWN